MNNRLSPIHLTLGFIVAVFLVFFFFGAELNTDQEITTVLGTLKADYVERGMLWLLLTSGFVHLDPIHLIFNLIALYQLGHIAQMFYGDRKVFSTFIISIITGNLLTILIFNIADISAVSVGASGGIFGILGLLVGGTVFNRRYGMGLPFRTENFYPTLALAILISFMPNVNWVAHLGGFLGGFALGYIFKTSNDMYIHSNDEKLRDYVFYFSIGTFVISYALLVINLIFEIVPI